MSDFGGRFRERTAPQPYTSSELSGLSYGHYAQIEYSLDDGHIIEYFPGGIPVQFSRPFLVRERCWDRKNPGPPYHDGGPFTLLKSTLGPWKPQGQGTYVTAPENLTGPSGSERFGFRFIGGFEDPFFLGDSTTDYTLASFHYGVTNSLIPDISGLGPEAYRRLRPQLEHAGMGQFLGEIRDVPHTLKSTAQAFHNSWSALIENPTWLNGINRGRKIINFKRMKFMPKKVSDHFVGVEFGWLPFIRDLTQFYDVYQNSKEYIARNKERNNTWQRRTKVLSETEDDVQLSAGGQPACSPSGEDFSRMMRTTSVGPGIPGKNWYETRARTYTHIWATGRFKYYSPEFDETLVDHESQWNTVKRYLDVYGARINPSVLYKITPWSWLADWFGNVGSNIDNATAIAQDGLVSQNVFTMASQSRVVSQKTFMNFWNGAVTCEWFRTLESKQRVEGGPYGLGWSSSALSATQLAILGALGVSRVHP